jgi:hypothetical protein
LLDEGVQLLVEFDEELFAASARPVDDSNDWDVFLRKLKRFQARLGMWFDRDADVVTAFAAVLDRIYAVRVGVAGRVRAAQEAVASARRDDPEAAASSPHVRVIEEDAAPMWSEAKAQVDVAHDEYVAAARTYLAGDPLPVSALLQAAAP